MKKLLLVLLIGAPAFGRVAPSFSGDLLNGGRLQLKQALKKDRAVLLCFWATWCVPCLEELRHVTAKLSESNDLNIDLITVNVDTSETSSDVKPTLKLHSFSFPVVLDPKHEIFAKYQAEKSLPYSVLISGNGEITKSFSGYSETMFADIRMALKK